MMSKFEFLENLRLFFKGALDLQGKSTAMIENEALEEMDNFILLIFADSLGLPLPISYYALELLPYMEDELKGWDKRMLDKKSVWEKKGADLDMDP